MVNTRAEASDDSEGEGTTADSIGSGFVARLADHALLIELDGESVVYDARTSAFHLLNPTATVIASCLDGSSDLEDLVRDLANAFSGSADTVRSDVLDLARLLGRHGLLDGVTGDPKTLDDAVADTGHRQATSGDEGGAPLFLADPPPT